MAEKKQNNELDLEQMDQVSGGVVNQRKVKASGIRGLFGGKDTVYDVTREDTGEVVSTYKDFNKATSLDRYMNTNKRS